MQKYMRTVEVNISGDLVGQFLSNHKRRKGNVIPQNILQVRNNLWADEQSDLYTFTWNSLKSQAFNLQQTNTSHERWLLNIN